MRPELFQQLTDACKQVNLHVQRADVLKYMIDDKWNKLHIPYADDRGTYRHLQHRRSAPPGGMQKGINIVSGKKVIVK